MDATLKRKNIDLPLDAIQKLTVMAVSQGKSLKAYIEQILISKANSIDIKMTENPSPSGDAWYADPANIESVRKGFAEMKEGKGKPYTSMKSSHLSAYELQICHCHNSEKH